MIKINLVPQEILGKAQQKQREERLARERRTEDAAGGR